MTIAYPLWITPLLKFLRLLRALVDLKGENMPVQVKKWQEADPNILYWLRTIQGSNGQQRVFPSKMLWSKDHELLELVGLGFGIRLSMSVEQGKLVYRSHGHVLQLGRFLVPIPDNLLLGQATISEEAIADDAFLLNFDIVHPWWGRTYSYGGVFRVDA